METNSTIRKAGRPAKIEQSEMTETATAPKKGTKPGWKPASRLGYLKAPYGFTARWVRNDPDNVARKKSEGWVIMKPSDNKGTSFEPTDVTDPQATHNGIRYQDMIAMMLPDDLKSERSAYYKEEINNATRAIFTKIDEEFKSRGVQTYAPKGQAGRIVIE